MASDGYHITSAYNYKDAVQYLKKKEFDIALLDINLPDGSGLELCKEIRGRGQHTYIIFITANDIETDEHKYIKTAYGMGYQWIGGVPK